MIPDHLSYSAISDFLLCPSRWYGRRIGKWPEPPTFAQQQGLAVDASLCAYHAGEDWHSVLLDGWLKLNTEPYPADGLRKCADLINLYASLIVPRPEDETQVKLQIPIPGCPVPFLGFVDLARQEGAVLVDWKTTSSLKRWNQEYVDQNQQATAYLWAATALGGEPKPERFVFCELNTTLMEVRYWTTTRTPEQLSDFAGQLPRIYEDMLACETLGPDETGPGFLTHTCKPKSWCNWPERCFPPQEARIEQLAERAQSLFGGQVVVDAVITKPEPQRLTGRRG